MSAKGITPLATIGSKTTFSSMKFDGKLYHLGDNVELYAGEDEKPFIGSINNIFQIDDEELLLEIRWYYRWTDIACEPPKNIRTLEREYLYSFHCDDNEVYSLERKFQVKIIHPSSPPPPHGYFIRYFYDHVRRMVIPMDETLLYFFEGEPRRIRELSQLLVQPPNSGESLDSPKSSKSKTTTKSPKVKSSPKTTRATTKTVKKKETTSKTKSPTTKKRKTTTRPTKNESKEPPKKKRKVVVEQILNDSDSTSDEEIIITRTTRSRSDKIIEDIPKIIPKPVSEINPIVTKSNLISPIDEKPKITKKKEAVTKKFAKIPVLGLTEQQKKSLYSITDKIVKEIFTGSDKTYSCIDDDVKEEVAKTIIKKTNCTDKKEVFRAMRTCMNRLYNKSNKGGINKKESKTKFIKQPQESPYASRIAKQASLPIDSKPKPIDKNQDFFATPSSIAEDSDEDLYRPIVSTPPTSPVFMPEPIPSPINRQPPPSNRQTSNRIPTGPPPMSFRDPLASQNIHTSTDTFFDEPDILSTIDSMLAEEGIHSNSSSIPQPLSLLPENILRDEPIRSSRDPRYQPVYNTNSQFHRSDPRAAFEPVSDYFPGPTSDIIDKLSKIESFIVNYSKEKDSHRSSDKNNRNRDTNEYSWSNRYGESHKAGPLNTYKVDFSAIDIHDTFKKNESSQEERDCYKELDNFLNYLHSTGSTEPSVSQIQSNIDKWRHCISFNNIEDFLIKAELNGYCYIDGDIYLNDCRITRNFNYNNLTRLPNESNIFGIVNEIVLTRTDLQKLSKKSMIDKTRGYWVRVPVSIDSNTNNKNYVLSRIFDTYSENGDIVLMLQLPTVAKSERFTLDFISESNFTQREYQHWKKAIDIEGSFIPSREISRIKEKKTWKIK